METQTSPTAGTATALAAATGSASSAPTAAAEQSNALNDAFLLMTRALLQRAANGKSDLHDSRETYLALSTAFEEASARQRRAAALRLMEEDAAAILGFCFRQLLEVSSSGGDLLAAGTSVADLRRSMPLVTLERFRGWTAGSLLTQHLLKGAVLGEVIDMARVLDRVQGLPPAPMRAFHVGHFAAVVASQVPRRSMSDLVCFVLQVYDGHCKRERDPSGQAKAAAHGLVAVTLHAWASLESRLAVQRALQSLGDAVFEQTRELLAFEDEAIAVEGLSSAATDPALMKEPAPPSHTERDRATPTTPTPTALPRVIPDDESPPSQGIDEQFWKDLVS